MYYNTEKLKKLEKKKKNLPVSVTGAAGETQKMLCRADHLISAVASVIFNEYRGLQWLHEG